MVARIEAKPESGSTRLFGTPVPDSALLHPGYGSVGRDRWAGAVGAPAEQTAASRGGGRQFTSMAAYCRAVASSAKYRFVTAKIVLDRASRAIRLGIAISALRMSAMIQMMPRLPTAPTNSSTTQAQR